MAVGAISEGYEPSETEEVPCWEEEVSGGRSWGDEEPTSVF